MEYGQQYSQPGVTGPMVGQSGQYGPGQFPGQQMNPTPQYMQPAPGGYNPAQMAQPGQPGMVANQQHAQKQPSTVVEVIRSNYTTIALFEVSGGYDPAQQYPKALCFVMGVPGVKDPSKQSGRRYEQSQKIVMKFSTQEIRSLGQSLINIATFKQAAAPFEKHSDPSKNSYSQNNGQQNTKKLKATFDQGRNNIVITMNFGQGNVMVPVPLQDAYGLGHDLINIGNFADAKLAEYKLAHRIGREEVAGIDYDPAGTEDYSITQQAPAAQVQQAPAGYNPAMQQYNPAAQQQAPAPQYNPAMQQAPVGYNPALYQGMPGQH